MNRAVVCYGNALIGSSSVTTKKVLEMKPYKSFKGVLIEIKGYINYLDLSRRYSLVDYQSSIALSSFN